MPARSRAPGTRTIRTATSSRRARRPTHCARRRPRARRSRRARLASCTVAGRFQQHERLRRPTWAPPARRSTISSSAGPWGWTSTIEQDEQSTATTAPTERRPSFHGDVVHSRPVAINMGTDASPEVVVFYGGNDGVLRAINGNRDRPSHRQRRRRRRDVGLHAARVLSRTSSGCATTRRRSISSATHFAVAAAEAVRRRRADRPRYRSATATLWLYASHAPGRPDDLCLRRLDDPHHPSSPTLKWRKGCPNLANDTGCTPGFEEIGQTWSAPKVMKAAGYYSAATPRRRC